MYHRRYTKAYIYVSSKHGVRCFPLSQLLFGVSCFLCGGGWPLPSCIKYLLPRSDGEGHQTAPVRCSACPSELCASASTQRTACCRFLGGGTRYSRGNGRGVEDEHSSNVNGGNIQLIKAVVCAGLYPNVTVAPTSLCPTSTSTSASGGSPKRSGGGGSQGGGKGAEKTAGEVSVSSIR